MFEVRISKFIQCPTDTAFAFISDFENDIKWWPGVIQAKRLTSEHQVGARYWQKNRVMGLTYSLTLCVDDYVNNQKISFHSQGSAIIFSGEYLFSEENNGTVFTMNAKVEANHTLFRLTYKLFRRSIERMTEKNFSSLKLFLETHLHSNS